MHKLISLEIDNWRMYKFSSHCRVSRTGSAYDWCALHARNAI